MHRNSILNSLPETERDQISARLEATPLHRKQVLYDKGREIEHVYFIAEGVASVVTELADGTEIETATIGNEGVVGIGLFLGAAEARERAFMQLAGDGHRMGADDFRRSLAECPHLRGCVARYTLALLRFLSQTSACDRKHSIDRRCARWLLLTHDRAGRNTIELTQQFLSQMLGVRRATVNEVMANLQKAGAVEYTRGKVTIQDRGMLEATSCACYGAIRREFNESLGGECEPEV